MSSLRRRLSLTLALVLIAAGALLAVGLQDFPRRLVEDYVAGRLGHDADLLYVRLADAVAVADPGAGDIDPARLGSAGPVYELPLSGHYFLIERGGQRIRSRSMWDTDIPLAAAATGGRLDGPAGQSLLVVAKRFQGVGNTAPVVVTVAEDLAGLDAAIADFRLKTLAVLALALSLLLILQRRLLLKGLAPLDSAVEACRRLERGEPADLDATAPSEVQPMLDAVGRLARHHAQRLGRIRHAVGNLSHALKTPLAVLAQQADGIEAQGDTALAATMRGQVDAMGRTIERELRRARLAGGGSVGATFDARAQLQLLADVLQRLHGEGRIGVEIDAPEQGFPADREDMLELFGNLLDNAFKWARSRVRVVVAPDASGRVLAFSVEDDGPGVPGEVLERLGAAGLRTDEARPGHGLGLAIVSDIVAQYGGAIGFGNGAALGGLRVDVRLPLTD
ncbi:sensor histidine kinase [Zoogloea sp. 1C4]|uniref:sensor histidine kinase n=1 Tax=Zoogloea sp. 1C4 TaxID=2570190 RepID=UPI001290E8C1|nr:sensor histidine kinase [Zoogloea sp. 1C4]